MADAHLIKGVKCIKGAVIGVIDDEDIGSSWDFGNFFERFTLRTSGDFDDFVEISDVGGGLLVNVFVNGKKSIGMEFLSICQIV